MLAATALSAFAGLASAPALARRQHDAGVGRTTARVHVADLPVPGPTVQVMIVGAGNIILRPAEALNVPVSTVTTSHGTCALAAGTPLAALAVLHRSGGPAFSVRDYGHCNSSPSNSGQLFVYSLDGETNHGQNGWEYKVNGRSGTTGAADPSGPEGNGRKLASGSRVLWFWCQAFDGGCERTLEVSVPSSVARGASFSVKVTGYDNEGHGQAMSGARVSLLSSSAVTSASGRATLRAPAKAGLYSVHATRTGSVPSFPEVVQVR